MKLEKVQELNGLEVMKDFVLNKLDELDEEQLRKVDIFPLKHRILKPF